MKTTKVLYVAIGILVVLALWATSLLWSTGAQRALAKRREDRIKKNTANSFVIVHYHFKKSERPKPPDDDYDYDEDDILDYVLNKRTEDVVGLIISEKGEIFIPENSYRPETIDKITVTGPDGAQLQASQGRILSRTQGQIIGISSELPEGWKPLSFSKAPQSFNMESKIYRISLHLDEYGEETADEQRGHFSIGSATAVRKRSNQSKVPDYFSVPVHRGVAVICGEDGRAWGVTAYGKIEISPDGPIWRGGDILADEGIIRGQAEEEIKEQFGKYLYQVKVTFRRPPKEDDEYDMGMFGSFWGGWPGQGDGEKELFVYGLAIGPDKILVPQALPQEMVAGVDKIFVRINDEYVRASFAGVLKQCEATVLTLEKPDLPNVMAIDDQIPLPRIQPFWTVYAQELAGKDLVIDYNRWVRKRRGYEQKLYRQPERPLRKGSWLLDTEGRLAGFYTEPRRDYQRILAYLKGEGFEHHYRSPFSFTSFMPSFPSNWEYSSYGGGDMGIFDAATLAAILDDLPGNYDPHIRHLTKEQQKERVWLGVEFTSISKEMAKQLKLREPTQDGRIGLIVNRVYPDSPAAKMGLAEGDVLLKLNVPGAPWPIELKYDQDFDYEGPDWGEVDVPEEFERMGFRVPRKRPWPSRENFFTKMLLVIGQETKVQLTYVHDGQEMQKEFTIEQSLPDSLSAQKHKDKKLGLTVKNLTYEVRAGLKLSAEDKAVVVSKVEPGTPAALARINAFELIRAVDGQEIGSVAEFKAAVAAAKDQKKPSVRITVEWMGKKRLTDLKFEAKSGSFQNILRKIIPGPS